MPSERVGSAGCSVLKSMKKSRDEIPCLTVLRPCPESARLNSVNSPTMFGQYSDGDRAMQKILLDSDVKLEHNVTEENEVRADSLAGLQALSMGCRCNA